MPTESGSKHTPILRLIAVFKLFKAVLSVAVGIGALKLFHQGAVDTLFRWILRVGLNPDGRLVDHALGKVASIPPDHLRDFGFGSFFYAALFLAEGTGLWLGKHWAEWFTLIVTTSLIPLEIYELVHHPSAVKVLVLLINIAVVVYLALRIRKRGAEQQTGTENRQR